MNFPGNLQEMLQKAQQLQGDIAKMQEEAAKQEVEASAGGGMVTVKVNGKHEIVSLKIDPSVVNPNDIEMLQDLITAAVNSASRQAKDILKNQLSKLTGGIPIPGFNM
ncbi:MAG: YbaB/EbfC family nucleoid-associated protein [Deltaproteobacteria bacterium]|nr:YbaB/EbfC family nucleoid-associated protein [Deltaproteobacteria bacterium]